MAHNTRNHARMCLFGVRPMANHVYGVKFPQNTTNRQKIGHFVREVDTNEEWRHRRMTSMTPRRLRCCKCIVQGQTTDHSLTAFMLIRQIHTKFSRNQGNFTTAGTLVPSSVNGDIAIQWEWSNFDQSQNPNPLTDYDKTLHNWLRPRDEHVTKNFCQSP